MRYTVGSAAEASGDAPKGCARGDQAGTVDALLVDQTEPAGATIAEYWDLPFVTICNALALNREPSVPPPFMDWDYREGLCGGSGTPSGTNCATSPYGRLLIGLGLQEDVGGCHHIAIWGNPSPIGRR